MPETAESRPRAEARAAGRGSNPRLWIGLAVSAICMVLVSRKVNWASFAAALRHLNMFWLSLGALANAASYVCSGIRWRQVIAPDADLSVKEAYDVVTIANLATLIAPSRAGDLAKAALVSRRRPVPVSRVLGAIVVERFADVVILVVLAALLSAVVTFPAVIRAGVTAFMIAGFGTVVAVFAAADWVPRLAGRIVGMVVVSWGAAVQTFLHGVFSGVRSAGRIRRFPGTLVWTTVIWAVAILAMWCNVRAMALPVPWYAAAFVLLVVNLGGVIPASPGSIGVYHYLAVSALAVWHVDAAVALGFAVVSHAAGIVMIAALGFISLAVEHESLLGVSR